MTSRLLLLLALASPLCPRVVSAAPAERELIELEDLTARFAADAEDYREVVRQEVLFRREKMQSEIERSYDKAISGAEQAERKHRAEAIAVFESFVAKHPKDPRYTPDALFRLSELYFDRSYDDYVQARRRYDLQLVEWERDREKPEPIEPEVRYEPTIATMQRLITDFPDYRLLDGAYYLLGYCLAELAELERAVEVYQELVERRPGTRFAPEVWTRIGEYYFDANELSRAVSAYERVLPYVDSPFYDKALYKLAWTHYRLADPELAPGEYLAAVDHFVMLLDFNESTRAAGEERGGDLRSESIQYIAISFSDEQWGGLSKLVGYLQRKGGRPYERDLYVALGDVYLDQTRFAEAIAAYALAQQRYPLHAGAPATQQQIVLAYERNRDFAGAARERERLVRDYAEGSAWYVANRDDEEALTAAEALAAEALYTAAVFHHRQAQSYKEANALAQAMSEYGKAAAAYGLYLQRFPHDKQLYELMFFHGECLYYALDFEAAAARYREVRDSGASQKYFEEAAFSVILAYENAAKAAEGNGTLPKVHVRKSNERTAGEEIVAKPLAPLRLAVIEASDRYLELFPESPRSPTIAYKAAELFYAHDQFDEARRRFRALLAAYPRAPVCEYAANLVIESYLTERDYAAVESFSRELLAREEVAARSPFASELVKFKTGAMFKRAESLGDAGEKEASAEVYLKMLEENPGSEFADSALNNAAVAFEEVKRYDSASRLYRRLADDHPKSPLADNALFRVGINAERFFNFEQAIDAYTRLMARYPKSDKRADALFNSALALENTQAYEKAAAQYERYCELFRKRADAAKVCFRVGVVYEKMGAPRRVVVTYERFVRAFRADRAHAELVIEAELKMAKAYELLREEKKAAATYARTVKDFRRMSSPKAAVFAAEAEFQLAERERKNFSALRLQGNSREQKAALTRKAKMLASVEQQYKRILEYKQIEWTLASLFRIGQLYQSFADSLVQAPCPNDVRSAARGMGATVGEVCDEYRVLLEERAAAIEDKAVAAYEATITRARELEVANVWTKRTLLALNKLRGSMWPLQKDAKEHVEDAPFSVPPLAKLVARGAP